MDWHTTLLGIHDLLTDRVEGTILSVGEWKYKDSEISVWIGSPDGSRRNQLEFNIRNGNSSLNVTAKTFNSLRNKLKRIDNHNLAPSKRL